jgi:hypothetical protein
MRDTTKSTPKHVSELLDEALAALAGCAVHAMPSVPPPHPRADALVRAEHSGDANSTPRGAALRLAA